MRTDHRVTDISMGGCTLETTTTLPQGTFIELVIKPASDEEPIKIGSAMVCTSRPESMGRFLEMMADDKNRLSQVILSLLIGQSANLQLFS
ncbi:PilZ domain-containing protein [Nitrospira sp. BLG_2]|uniref:PilZ domain-containing protein n=1 Tax=Nitrospira sp. BLG_2 TaxID=3397507 RepID=UPI003B9C4336